MQDKYPGKVNLPDGLQITLTSDGNNYNTTGIYLEGVDTNKDPKGSHDESKNANVEFQANGNKISDTRVEAGNDVTLSVKTGKFNNDKNTTYGFYQLFYGDTTIGDRLTSTVESTVDNKTKRLVISPLTSAHDHPTADLIEALAHDKLTLGDDAHLTSTVTATTETKKEGQEICQYGAYLSQTDYKIGKNMQIRYTSIKQKKALQASSRSMTGASSRAMK